MVIDLCFNATAGSVLQPERLLHHISIPVGILDGHFIYSLLGCSQGACLPTLVPILLVDLLHGAHVGWVQSALTLVMR